MIVTVISFVDIDYIAKKMATDHLPMVFPSTNHGYPSWINTAGGEESMQPSM